MYFYTCKWWENVTKRLVLRMRQKKTDAMCHSRKSTVRARSDLDALHPSKVDISICLGNFRTEHWKLSIFNNNLWYFPLKHRSTLTESTIIYLVETPGSLESLRISSGETTCNFLSRNLNVSVDFLSGDNSWMCTAHRNHVSSSSRRSLFCYPYITMESLEYRYQALFESPHKKGPFISNLEEFPCTFLRNKL